MMRRLGDHLRAFRGDESGAALVEFALLLPTFLLFLGISVEGARTFWSYQSTVTGVRDAARFVSRAAGGDICTSGASLSVWNSRLTQIVRDTQAGPSLFPAAVSIDAVTAALACTSGNFRSGPAPVATVTATLTIDYPFRGLFGLMNIDMPAVTTVVSDSARIVGA